MSVDNQKQNLWSNWGEKACLLKRDTFALFFACRDARVPWGVKAIAACVVAYAFSPIDLIPDFIPVLGYLDDLILVPLGIALVLKLIPPSVMSDCRRQAQAALEGGSHKPTNWIAAGIIVLLWLLGAGWMGMSFWHIFHPVPGLRQ